MRLRTPWGEFIVTHVEFNTRYDLKSIDLRLTSHGEIDVDGLRGEFANWANVHDVTVVEQ